MTTPAIDLTRYRAKFVNGDITMYATWYWNEEEKSSEPALVFVPTFRKTRYVAAVALSSAYKYNDARYLVQTAHQISRQLGFEPSMSLTHKIGSMIYDHLDDLVLMPPEPTENVAVADGQVMFENGQTRSVEFTEKRRTN